VKIFYRGKSEFQNSSKVPTVQKDQKLNILTIKHFELLPEFWEN